MRVQQVEIEKGFGTIRAGNGKDVIVYTEGGEFGKVVSMRRSQRACEGARADEANNHKGTEDEADGEASKADGDGNGGSEQDKDEVIEMQGPANEDARGQTDERDEEAGETGTDHTVNAGEVFRREVADGKDTLRLEDKDTPAIALATGEIEAEKGDAGDEQDKGAIAQNGEQGILPFEIGRERMSVSRPEKDGGYRQQS